MTAPEVTIGRLRRKITKLQQQRDYWKVEHDRLDTIMQKYPFIKKRVQDVDEWRAERRRVRDLECRVEEQAKLIQMLQKEKL